MNRFSKKFREKIARLTGDPQKVAGGFALGSFMGVSPFIGMQILISLGLALLFKLSKTAVIAGVINTNWSKGLLIYPLNYKIGCWLMGQSLHFDIPSLFKGNPVRNLLESGVDVFLPLFIGGCITGSILALFYYVLVKRILDSRKTAAFAGEPVPQKNPGYALVTGASQGLGKAIALELASRGIPVLLVALRNEGLDQLCARIRSEFGVDARFFETDLGEHDSVYEVATWAMGHYPVFMLINNAGVGGTRGFEHASPQYVDTIIQVNVRATSMLTRLLLPELKKHPRAYILNVASMASFSPMAFKTVYPASKAFVYSFSRGLHEELRGTSVFVSVIHPGPIMTNPEVIARIEKQGVFGKIGLVSAERLAKISVTGLLKGDSLILPGWLNKINRALMVLIPNAWKLPLLARVVRREISGRPVQAPAA